MGNAESKEGETETPVADAEEDNFDLDKIPDDRDPDDDISQLRSQVSTSASPQGEMRSTNKLKNRKANKKTTVDKSHRARSFSLLPNEAQPISQGAPESSQLRDLEPETFHIYETSDGSDVDDAPKARKSLRPPEDERQEVSDTNTGNVTDDSSQEDEEELMTTTLPTRATVPKKTARSKLPGERNDVPKTSAGRASQSRAGAGTGFTAVNRRLASKANSAANTTPDAPSADDNGRWPCPSAETYGCTKTFSSRKAATRHADSHSAKYTCAVCRKILSRADSLKTHMKRHTALEISMAEAGKEQDRVESEADTAEEVKNANSELKDMQLNESPEAEAPGSEAEAEAEPEPLEVDGAEEHDSDGESTELGADGSPEYTTPAEASPAELPMEDDHIDANEDPEVDHAPPPAIQRILASPRPNAASNDDLITETPISKQSQKRKRKRKSQSPSDPESVSSGRLKRRKKTTISSPTLGPSSADLVPDLQAQQVTQKIVPQLQARRQSSIENWTQSYNSSSNPRHPSLDPVRPPKRNEQIVEVLVPRTSQAGSSSQIASKSSASKTARQEHKEQNNDKKTSNLLANFTKSKKSEYTTTNGKGRAEAGVNYNSPMKTARPRDSAQEASGIATSVAKRTFSKASASEADEESASDYTGDTAEKSVNEQSSLQPAPKKAANEMFECRTCHAKFKSEKALKKHVKKPNVHTYLLKCQACNEKFPTGAALARHERETGHGDANGRQGQVGAFGDSEVRKLNNWKDLFCEEHHITGAQFNDMMTDTLQRGRGGTWNWLFINRLDFMAQYFSVLPRRDKRSMLRYRERNFQNLEGSLNWTDEDDKELLRLHKEMGTQWSKIAKAMMRTQDAVAQRWRHKLQFKETESGEWSREENSALNKAIEAVRNDAGVSADAKNWSIPWSQVSQRMKTRTPAQCSNHYRALHGLHKSGKYVPIPALEKTPGKSRVLTPSKMQKRLEGTASNSGKRAELSSKYVDDEDSDVEDLSEEQHNPAQEKASEDRSNGIHSDNLPEEHNGNDKAEPQTKANGIDSDGEIASKKATETPHTNRKLLTKNTPGKTLGSSQLFAQTQTNTSALRPPPSNPRRSTSSQVQSQSQERPSPNVPIQLRAATRSPLQEIHPYTVADLHMGENDDSQDSDNNDDEDAGAAANKNVEIQQSEDEEPADEDADDTGSIDLANGANGDNESRSLVDDEPEETSDENTSSDEEEDNEDNDEDKENDAYSGDDSEGDEQESSVDDTTFDFMASINKSAQRSKSSQIRSSQGQNRGLKRKSTPSDDDSEDEETESE
ncbi:hypothetical protein LTR84_011598 [Exophiala bonariae]|uniref:Uncharacterized protein n=1 Tax=Exophiala bonariae TaxID=1690606 RepID=A0AAV9NGM4_9EURO|nr:hypothetical protein LTR84_011598 [Exophiala bonariae]